MYIEINRETKEWWLGKNNLALHGMGKFENFYLENCEPMFSSPTVDLWAGHKFSNGVGVLRLEVDGTAGMEESISSIISEDVCRRQAQFFASTIYFNLTIEDRVLIKQV
jgi:hypothetical protein